MANTEKNPSKQDTKPYINQIDTSSWDEVGANVDGFYAPETTGRLIGRVIEVFTIDGDFGRQALVKVQVAEPAKALVKDGEQVDVPVGGIVAVRISAALTVLLDCVEHKCAIEIVPQGKIPVRRGTMWKYRVRTRGQRVPYQHKVAVSNDGGNSSATDEDLPF